MEEKIQDALLDRASGVRPGEEVDAGKLFTYLAERLPEISGPLVVEQFQAGFSNLTYLLRSGASELVLRRPPMGANIKTAHDMLREYRILSHLFPVYRKVPRPLLYCDDPSVLGAPFYVMERVRGVILRARRPKNLELSAGLMRRLSESFIQTLAEIHRVDYEAAGLVDLGHPAGYVRRQVEGWTKRYGNARTGEVPAIERLTSWLAEHAPSDAPRACLIHNDFKYDNLVLSPDNPADVIAVLDWEMATIGDPLMDLGTSLGYWVDPDDPPAWQQCGFGLTTLPGNLTRQNLWDYYAGLRGRDLSGPVFYYAYGLLKIAVIVQQIYARYRRGLTHDERFAKLDAVVAACGEMACRAIEKQRIDRLG